MKTSNPTHSPRWSVSFETDDGFFHPVWYGKLDGPPISRERILEAANEYLSENTWLKHIDCIEPCEY